MFALMIFSAAFFCIFYGSIGLSLVVAWVLSSLAGAALLVAVT
jgi:hypothetical protein